MMIRFTSVLLASVLMVASPVSQVYAQAETGTTESPAAETPKTEPDANGVIITPSNNEPAISKEDQALTPNERAKKDALTEKVADIIKGLDLNQIQHFTVIYANYMVLSMVNAVQKDVSNAVTACGEKNSDMKADMDARFEAWKTALEKPREDSKANINNMIVAQNYLPKEKFDDIFALVDETRAKNSSEFEKIPVSTPEACKYMLGKMDETQKNMIQMLSSTLVTYPNMLQKAQK